MTEFATLALEPAVLDALATLGYSSMTPIQAASLPAILDGKDVLAQAPTGSGKTVAFGLGLVARLDPAVVAVQGLVLCPTRELADKVSRENRRLASIVPNVKLLTLCGGIPLRPQLASLVHPPHVVVGTPGRIQELIDQGALSLECVRVLVLDEVDRMLDMGFQDAVTQLLKQCPQSRQTLLFSATLPDEIRSISRSMQREPVSVTCAAEEEAPEIEQQFFEVDGRGRFDALVQLLGVNRPESCLVFCNTRRDGTLVLKFWLNVSQAEQRERLLERLDDPDRNWKFEADDLAERALWPEYMAAYEAALRDTSRPHAPWYAIPADDKAFMRMTVAEIVVGALTGLKLRYPDTTDEERQHFAELRKTLEDDAEADRKRGR